MSNNLFGNLNTNANIEKEKDTLGGGGVLDSNIYLATIDQAYFTQAQSGAKGVVMKFSLDKDGVKVPFTTTFWVTNRNGQNYYEYDGKTAYLMGYNQANSIARHLGGADLGSLPVESRTLPVYNFEQRKEVPTAVQAFPSLFGKQLSLGLLKTRENKKQKVGNEYISTADEVFRNNVDKIFFIKDNRLYTSNELEANEANPDFAQKWKAKNEGQIQDRYEQVSGQQSITVSSTASTVEIV